MLAETNIGRVPARQLAAAARRAEALGFHRVSHSEVTRDSFLSSAVSSQATTTIGIATSVAIAFPRSPMVTAYAARHLQDLSEGRFFLGLGTQVRGHIERRFSAEFDSPGPRFREYLDSLAAIFRSWRSGEPLSYHGKFYDFSLMQPEFSPGPGEFPDPPVHISAVNKYNLALAGERCAGVRLHPLMTAAYVRDEAIADVRRGLEKSGRPRSGFEVVGGGFIAAGTTEEQVAAGWEAARKRVGWYASTKAYRPILRHHGWEDLADEARRLSFAQRWADLEVLVDDSVLAEFCVAGSFAEVAAQLRARWAGVADTITLPADVWSAADDDETAGLVSSLAAPVKP